MNEPCNTIDGNKLVRIWSDRREAWLLRQIQYTREEVNGGIVYTLDRVDDVG